MTQNLSYIHNRLAKAINKNFTDTIYLQEIVTDVKPDLGHFTIGSTNHSLECHCMDKIDNIQIGDTVNVKGNLRPDKTGNGKLVFNVEHYSTITEDAKHAIAKESYDKLTTVLKQDKYINLIAQIAPRHLPENINNVGLIALDTTGEQLELLKKAFTERCYGKLFVYKLDEQSADLKIPIDLFTKYHEIDLVCLLTNKLSTDQIFALSTKAAIRTMMHRKNCPYLVSVTTNCHTVPLATIITNNPFTEIESFINLIENIQQSSKKYILDQINFGQEILRSIMDKKRKKLFNLKMTLTKFSDPKFGSVDTNPVVTLKRILGAKLAAEKMKLQKIHSNIMTQIIEEERIQSIFGRVIEHERYALAKAKISSGDNTGLNISDPVSDQFTDAAKLSNISATVFGTSGDTF